MFKELLLSLNTVLATVGSPSQSLRQNTSDYLSPITGVWQLQLDQVADCKEIYNFKENNQLSVVSGQEWTSGSYYFKYNRESELPRFVMITEADDNNIDCSGNQVDQTGDGLVAYYKKESASQFKLCADDAGAICFMTFNRILP